MAAAVLRRLVADGVIYEMYKPCDELKNAIAQVTSSPGKKLNEVDVQSEVSSKLSATVLLSRKKKFLLPFLQVFLFSKISRY